MKVFAPVLVTRIEETRYLTRSVQRRDVRSFQTIAVNACVSQVLQKRLTAVLHADDVVYLMTERGISFRKQAILAPEFGPTGYLPSKRVRNLKTHERLALGRHELSSGS